MGTLRQNLADPLEKLTYDVQNKSRNPLGTSVETAWHLLYVCSLLSLWFIVCSVFFFFCFFLLCLENNTNILEKQTSIIWVSNSSTVNIQFLIKASTDIQYIGMMTCFYSVWTRQFMWICCECVSVEGSITHSILPRMIKQELSRRRRLWGVWWHELTQVCTGNPGTSQTGISRLELGYKSPPDINTQHAHLVTTVTNGLLCFH